MGEKTSWKTCVLWGCLGLVLVIAGGIASCVGFYRWGSASVTPVTDAYLEDVGRGDLEAAYERLGSGVTDDLDEDQYIAFETTVRQRLGTRTATHVEGVSFNKKPEGTFAQVVYAAAFEHGTAKIKLTLQKRAEGWIIEGVSYDSPELKEQLTCPRCGAKVQPDDRFCPQCGAPLHGSEE